jgi:hypothetical protein
LSNPEIYVPGVGYIEQAVRWLGQKAGTTLVRLNRLWVDVRRDRLELDITTAHTLAQVSVPRPPETYDLMVEGFCNFAWPSGSALHASLRLEAGTAVLATALCFVDSSAGSHCARLVGSMPSRQDANVQLIIEREASRSTVSVDNRGVWGWYFKED